jgi:hypothetical protein
LASSSSYCLSSRDFAKYLRLLMWCWRMIGNIVTVYSVHPPCLNLNKSLSVLSADSISSFLLPTEMVSKFGPYPRANFLIL